MFKTLALAAGSAAAILIVWAVVALQSSRPDPASPPLTGWMQNFTPASAPGPAPRTLFAGRDGGDRTLADFGGKIVLVNFWATWCAPCVREMPSLVRLHRTLAGDRFALLAMSQDLKGWAAIDPFVKRLGLAELEVFLDRDGALLRIL